MAQANPQWQPVRLPGDVPTPVGKYSPGVRAGDFIFVSGQVPRDPNTGEMVGTDVESQTRQVLTNVSNILAAAGAGLSDVVSMVVYLQNVDDWGRFNTVYGQIMPQPYPTRTALGADLRGILVEISAVAYKPRS
jgi:2-iminobutanoate/2-iminopropanoate deaminase